MKNLFKLKKKIRPLNTEKLEILGTFLSKKSKINQTSKSK